MVVRRLLTTLETVSPTGDLATTRALGALHAKTFLRPCGPEYYRWMYGDRTRPSALVVARCDDQILGTMGARVRRMASGLMCGQLMDMIVAPEARGSGLFADLAGHTMERLGQVDFWFSHANPAGAEALIRKAGFDMVGMVSVLEGARAALDVERAAELAPQVEAEELADRIDTSGPDAAWRFEQHPHFDYRTIGRSAMGPVRVKGFVDGQTTLLDLMTPFHGPELPEIIRSADASDPAWTRMYFWSAPHLSARRTALDMGFVERPQRRCLVGRPANALGAHMADFDRWFVSASDTEYM